MPILVEDGTGLANANSYLSTADAATLLAYHGDVADWNALVTSDQEFCLERATEFLDIRWRWYGQTLTDTQSLQWPRTRTYNSHGKLLPPGGIPPEIKKACAYLAVLAASNGSLLTNIGQTGGLKQYFTEGLNVVFDPTTTQDNLFMGLRVVELELMLKNMGELKSVDWLKNQKNTETRV